MVPRLLVFDLDGTLIDSQVDLANSINAMLVHLGKPELPHAVLLGYIGDGATMLVRRALGDPEGDVHDEQYVNEALESKQIGWAMWDYDGNFGLASKSSAGIDFDPAILKALGMK